MTFQQHPPSTAWEPVPLQGGTQSVVWAWYKPPTAPQSLVFQIPPETFRDPSRRWPITPRLLVESAGIEVRSVTHWTLSGLSYDGDQGGNPAWNFAIHEPGAGERCQVAVFIQAPTPATSPQPRSQVTPQAGQTDWTPYFGRIEAEWTASLHLEVQLNELSRHMNSALSRCTSLNRELSGEEAHASDQVDRQEWLEARRRLRDTAHKLARFLKEQNIGTTSAAGQRPVFERIYEEYIVTRRYFDGIEKADRDFEGRRKSLQILLDRMKSAQFAAGDEAERKAKVILSRIAAKIRKGKKK